VSTKGAKTTAENGAIDGEWLPPAPPKIRLSDLESVRREAAAVYRDMRRGAIKTQDGTRLIYALDRIGHLLEVAQLEQRIAALEQSTDERE
jgi:hypothetical protein